MHMAFTRPFAALVAVAAIGGPALAGPLVAPRNPLESRANTAFGLADSSVVTMVVDPTPGQAVVAFLPIDGAVSVLDLQPHSIRADGYRLLVQGADGVIRDAEPGVERTLEGSLLGIEGSSVVGSMLDDGLHARIVVTTGVEYWLEPLSGRIEGAGSDDYVLYRAEDVLETGGTCMADAIEQPFLGHVTSGDGGPPAGPGGAECTELACDADVEYYENWGSSVSNVEAQISSIISAINGQYASEVGITHSITAIVVRTAEPDPYKGKNASSILNAMRSEWETNLSGIQRDVAQLFTGRDLSGTTIGIAWLNAVCTTYGYSLVQSDFDSAFACKTDLSAHELGHNWGAGHCSCVGYTMNSYITYANQFHPTFTVPDIINFRNTRTCIGTCDGGGGPVCGNGVCEAGEDAASCPGDCGTPEMCGNGVDDDGDGLADCDDPDCTGDPACDGPPPSGDASIPCITYTTKGGPNGDKHLEVTVTVVDDTQAPIAGASVTLVLTGPGTSNFGGTTDDAGEVTFTLINAASGCYSSGSITVSGVATAAPANGFQKGSDATPDADCAGDAGTGCGLES